MEEYLRHNLQTYDALAPAYAQRVAADILNDLPLVYRVWSHVERHGIVAPSLLDLGCGHGVNLAMFSRLGAITTGLDFSADMIRVARQVSPDSEFLNSEFLTCGLSAAAFDVVFAKAFIHLFPIAECSRVLERVRSIVRPGGLLYIATTWSLQSSEGYQVKADYAGGHSRFRRVWDYRELAGFCATHGFKVIDTWDNEERSRNKKWFNIVAEAQDGFPS